MLAHRKMIEILCVEDNPADRRLIQEFLVCRKFQCHLSFAADGLEAMQFLGKKSGFATAPTPDIILLDLNLPRIDGREVLRLIKADNDLGRIPVIIFSTSSSPADISSSYEMHANCYLVKPDNVDEYEEVMEKVRGFWVDTAQLTDRRECA